MTCKSRYILFWKQLILVLNGLAKSQGPADQDPSCYTCSLNMHVHGISQLNWPRSMSECDRSIYLAAKVVRGGEILVLNRIRDQQMRIRAALPVHSLLANTKYWLRCRIRANTKHLNPLDSYIYPFKDRLYACVISAVFSWIGPNLKQV